MIFKMWTADYVLTQKGMEIFNNSEYAKTIFYKKNGNTITMNQSDATQIFSYPKDWVEKGVFEDFQNHESKLEKFTSNVWMVTRPLVLITILLSSLIMMIFDKNMNINMEIKENISTYYVWTVFMCFSILAANFGLLKLSFMEAKKNERKTRYIPKK